MTLAGSNIAGQVSVTAPTVYSNTATISKFGGSLVSHGPVNLNGAVTLGGVSLGGTVSQLGPPSFGLLAYNFSPQFATGTGSAVTTGGKLYLARLPLLGNTIYTNLWFSIATGAVTPTTAENWAGLYTATGTLVASTGDLTTAIGTNTGFIECPLSSAYTTPDTPVVMYVGLLFNAATLPVLTCYTGQVTVTTSVANLGSATTFGNTAATYPFSLAASSTNTVLPATVTMSTNTATGAYTVWVGAN
jgi:hypothetical protein